MIGHKIAHSLSQDFELIGSSKKKYRYYQDLLNQMEKIIKS